MLSVLRRLSLLLGLALALNPARAEEPAAPADHPMQKALAAAQPGPTEVKLLSQAAFKVPAGKVFIPQPQAGELLRAMGNPGDHRDIQGLVFPKGEGEDWFVVLRWEASGYVKDDDAKDWNADDMLKSFREGTEASNEERKKLGSPEMEIVGWAEKPQYDAATHRLVWAMSSRHKGAPANAEQGVNYNTYALGREGYFSLNLVTGLAELPQHKSAAHTLLGALEYKQGKRYADFDAKTDHVAEYGLAALVVGVAAKKLGFIALLVAFFAKFAKVILLGVAVLGAAFVKFFGKRKAVAAAAASGEPPRV